MSMKSQYRIIKLRSGEEIISKIQGQQKGTLILERPMVFRTMFMHDNFGRPKEVTVLRSWTPNTNQLHTKIPKDFIATFSTPSKEAITLYELEKEQEDTSDDVVSSNNNFPPPVRDPGALLEALMQLKEDLGIEDDPDEDGDLMEEEDEDDLPDMMNLVTMTLFFPPALLSKLVDNDIIDADDIKNLIQHLNGEVGKKGKGNKYTGDDIEHPNWGNRWTDWSEDLGDYLKGEEDEKQ